MKTFQELGLNNQIVAAIRKKGYENPTPIQFKAIPPVLSGSDVFGCAQTGTGKTAAFALPILQMLSSERADSAPLALILAPTRELAIQIDQNFSDYSHNGGIKRALVYGGADIRKQSDQVRRGVHVVIATPGRLLDLINRGDLKLNKIRYFVLDEADRMLDMGFIADIRKILKMIPSNRQSLFFSATINPAIQSLANGILKHDAVRVEADRVSSAAEKVDQFVYFTNKAMKKDLLRHIIIGQNIGHALVFTRTKHGADKVAKDLVKAGIKAVAIHGDKSQNKRERAIKSFADKTINVLVATDVASRGLDIKKLSHVINYEIPEMPETYIHRIGRTGRAGESGTAVSFCTHEEKKYWNGIKKLAATDINIVKDHPFHAN